VSTDQSVPDLIFVALIHQALRVDGDRLVRTVTALQPDDRGSRLSAVCEFYDNYRQQLIAHHTHEDTLFFPALASRVGDERMHRGELVSQHEQLDRVLEAVEADFRALANSNGDFSAARGRLAGDLRTMVEHLNRHLDLEEKTALPLVTSDLPPKEYADLESKARKATPRGQSGFMIPWMVEHASPEQRKRLYRLAPPLRIVYRLNRRRYRRLDDALLAPA